MQFAIPAAWINGSQPSLIERIFNMLPAPSDSGDYWNQPAYGTGVRKSRKPVMAQSPFPVRTDYASWDAPVQGAGVRRSVVVQPQAAPSPSDRPAAIPTASSPSDRLPAYTAASWPPTGRPMDLDLRAPAPLLDPRDYPGYSGPPSHVVTAPHASDPTILDAMRGGPGMHPGQPASWPPVGRPMDAELRAPAPMLDARDYPGRTGPPATWVVPPAESTESGFSTRGYDRAPAPGYLDGSSTSPAIPDGAIDRAGAFHPLLADIRNMRAAFAENRPSADATRTAFGNLAASGAPIIDPAGYAAGQAAINAGVSPTQEFLLRGGQHGTGEVTLGGLFNRPELQPAMSAADRERALSARFADRVFGGNTVVRQDSRGRPYFADANAVGGGAGNDAVVGGRSTMIPDEAMRALEMRTPGVYLEGLGYVPNSLIGTPSTQAGPGSVTSEERLKALRQRIGATQERAQLSDARKAELAARDAARRTRGTNRVRGGYLPPDGGQSLLLAQAMRTNPEAVARIQGQIIASEAEKRNAALTFLAAREQNAARNAQVQDALRAQNFQAMLDSGVPVADAMQFSGMQGGVAAPQAVAGVPTPADRGLQFTQAENARVAELAAQPGGGQNVIEYGRAQGWSDEKIVRALRSATGSQFATLADPGGWWNWMLNGTPAAPGTEPQWGLFGNQITGDSVRKALSGPSTYK